MVRRCTTGKGVEVGRSGAVSRRADLQKKTGFGFEVPRQTEPPPQRAVCARFHHAADGPRTLKLCRWLLAARELWGHRAPRSLDSNNESSDMRPASCLPILGIDVGKTGNSDTQANITSPPPETNKSLLSRWEGEGEGGTTTGWPAPRGTGRTQQTVA